MELSTIGLMVSTELTEKAYEVNYRNPYDASFSRPIYYAATPNKALAAWMREHHEHDFMGSKKAVRIKRDPDYDRVSIFPDKTEFGQTVHSVHKNMTGSEKLSLLAFAGLPMRSIKFLLRQQQTNESKKIAHPADLWIQDYLGYITRLETETHPCLFESDGVQLTKSIPFAHHPMQFQLLNDIGIAVFLLCVQDVLVAHDTALNHWLLELLCKRFESSPENECEKRSPCIFHKYFRTDLQLYTDWPERVWIYSGQWGSYWVNTSGYSSNKSKCQTFSLADAIDHTSHCGDEKRIYFRFMEPNDVAIDKQAC